MINRYLGSVKRLASPREAVKRAFMPFTQRHYPNLARLHRNRLNGVCFVGITGSCGKTTTKDLAAAVLSAKGEGVKGTQLFNRIQHVSRTVLSVKPSPSFCVEEIGASDPGRIVKSAAVFRPQIAVVTMIGWDHFSSYRSPEAIAAEKVALVEALPSGGTAVLNADDPLVWAMREKTDAKVIGYGLSDGATLRGEEISCTWPDRLSLTVVHGEDRVRIQTQLVGDTSLYSVLAALAVGVAAGVPLEEGARRIAGVEPVFARMSPHVSADGVTFINDTWKAPYYSLPDVLDFLRDARAERKIAVFGTFSDFPGSAAKKYREVARDALAIADKVIFICEYNYSLIKDQSGPDDDRLLVFHTTYELNLYLKGELRPGDLVLVKSAGSAHLERLIMDRAMLGASVLDRPPGETSVTCWRENCGQSKPCLFCEMRYDDIVPLPS